MDYQIASKYFDYDPQTGSLTRKLATMRSNGRIHSQNIGRDASVDCGNGYRRCIITHNGVKYEILAHRLVWLLVHKKHPKDQIDHINGNRSDNRICNLREATSFDNQRNRHKKSGKDSDLPIGVYRKTRKNRSGVWYVASCNGLGKRMSTYTRSLDSAIAARKRFESILWQPIN